MAVGMLVTIPDGTPEFYDSVMQHLEWDTKPKPDGFISHYAGPSPWGWTVFDVWESQKDFERFAEDRLGAALAAAGGGPQQIQPTFIPIHNQSHRG